jgi:DNA-directed RNA polymerase subunit F
MNAQENRTKIIDEANKAIEHAEFVRKIEDNRQELFEEFYTIMKDYQTYMGLCNRALE